MPVVSLLQSGVEVDPQLTHCRDSLFPPELATLPIKPTEPSSDPKFGSSLKIGEIDPDGLAEREEGGDEGSDTVVVGEAEPKEGVQVDCGMYEETVGGVVVWFQ